MSNMSFREKSAWISFVLILALGLIYFGEIGAHEFLHAGHTSPLLFPALVTAVIIIEIALTLALQARAPHEARTPRDEREQLIALKAKNISYPVLAVCAFAAIGTMHIPGGNRFDMAQAILFAIVAGELSRFGAQIVYFRRGF
jgi:hypothetical protein